VKGKRVREDEKAGGGRWGIREGLRTGGAARAKNIGLGGSKTGGVRLVGGQVDVEGLLLGASQGTNCLTGKHQVCGVIDGVRAGRTEGGEGDSRRVR